MKRKSVTLISALVLLAALCGAYYGIQKYSAEQEKKAQEESESEVVELFSEDSTSITKLKFIIEKTEVVFEKENDIWYKEDESEFPVDQDILTDAANSISSVTSEIEIDDVEDLEQYGLDDPSNTITITTEDGVETIFKIGSENESVNQYYVEKGDEKNKVYLVDSTIIDPFMKTLYEYAKAETFPDITSDNIDKIEITENETFYQVEKDSDTGFWYVSDGTESEKADSAKANSLTSAISTLEYSSFVNYNCTNYADYGLENPYGTIVVDYNEETENSEEMSSEENESEDNSDGASENDDSKEMIEKQLVLYVGDTAENDTRYVRINDSNEIYTIAQENLDTLFGKSVSDLWDMTVNYLSVNELDTLDIKIRSEEHQVSVSRETSENEDGEEEETLSYLLDGEQIDTNLFTTFYNKLINLSGQRRLTEEFVPEEEAELYVTFTDVNQNQKDLGFYSYDTNFYAAVIGEKVYLVNKMDIKDLIDSCGEMLGYEEKTN